MTKITFANDLQGWIQDLEGTQKLLELEQRLVHIVPNYKQHAVNNTHALIFTLSKAKFGSLRTYDTVCLIAALSNLRRAMACTNEIKQETVAMVDDLQSKFVKALGEIN
ncbi:MAG: hypothetical protein Q9191_003637 [Dirinaria sp. TL-2023a]